MRKLTDIVSLRHPPGVMILDQTGTLLFMNEMVSSIVPVVHQQVPDKSDQGAPTVPEAIRALCLKVDLRNGGEQQTSENIFYSTHGEPYAMRAFPLAGVAEQIGAQHIMVLVEPITERRQIDFVAVKKKYGLSNREMDVLKLVSQGMGNREIAERLFICEHTAKDHIKKIMYAFNVRSRSAVIAALSQ